MSKVYLFAVGIETDVLTEVIIFVYKVPAILGSLLSSYIG